MSSHVRFQTIHFYCLLLACVTSSSANPAAYVQHQDRLEDHDHVPLVQLAVKTTTGRKLTGNLDGLASSHIPTIDPQMSDEQIKGELQLAKQAREEWNQHVKALEALLQNKAVRGNEVQLLKIADLVDPDTSTVLDYTCMWYMEIGCFLAAFCITALYAYRAIVQHEKTHDESKMPWYHDSSTLWKVLTAGSILWMLVGLIACTKLLRYGKEGRHLTIIESIYMSVQILTTVGYGDFTPISVLGKTFKVVYCVTGVVLIGAMLTEALSNYFEHSESRITKLFPNMGAIPMLLPSVGFILLGTFVFANIPGEDKSVADSFYMSVITLLTIGFGDLTPKTPAGQLFACVWMLVGVACFGQVIADVAEALFNERQQFRCKKSAMNYFNSNKGDDHGIDRVEFLRFEFIRNGMEQSDFDSANASFDEVDVSKNGMLDAKEFKAYVDRVCV
mmetsp:Transcript_31442/g.51379  ORF Transcript_31442/g.51379 Transcript_31442/m.51379 type:complete len:446 (-) Transcript_31442:115-1452(-)